MSAAKHTPGPWVASELGDYGDYEGKCIVVLGEGGAIRTAVVLGSDNETHANARLIAVAPDLMEALQELIFDKDGKEWLDSDMPDREWDMKCDRAKAKARAAIAKATGHSIKHLPADDTEGGAA